MIQFPAGVFIMGRRRKKVVKIIKKTLPEFYLCPRCGKNTVKTTVHRKEGRAAVVCGNCGLSASLNVSSQIDEVDAYNTFIDDYYAEGKEEKVVG